MARGHHGLPWAINHQLEADPPRWGRWRDCTGSRALLLAGTYSSHGTGHGAMVLWPPQHPASSPACARGLMGLVSLRGAECGFQHPSDFWDPAPLTGLPEGWWEVVALEQRDVGGCQVLATVCVGTQQQQS